MANIAMHDVPEVVGDQPAGPSEAEMLEKFMSLPDGSEEEQESDADHPATESAAVDEEVGSDEAADEPVQTESQTQAPETFKVHLDGQEVEITRDELVKGYLRESDYTRKAQAIAAEKQAASEARAKYEAEALAYAQAVASIQPAEPTEAEWEQLRQSDPARYAAERLDWDRFRAEQRSAAAEAERIQAQRAAEFDQRLQAEIQHHRQKLLAAVPEWESEAKPNLEYAKSQGFTDEELATAYDHRTLLLLRKARLYDELMSKGAAQIAEKKVTAKVLQPGSRDNSPPAPAREAVRKQIEKVKRLGAGASQNDVMAAFLALPD